MSIFFHSHVEFFFFGRGKSATENMCSSCVGPSQRLLFSVREFFAQAACGESTWKVPPFTGSGGGSLTCAFCSGQVDFEAFARAGTVDSSIRSGRRAGQGADGVRTVPRPQRHFRYHPARTTLGSWRPAGRRRRPLLRCFSRRDSHCADGFATISRKRPAIPAEVAIDLEGRMKGRTG